MGDYVHISTNPAHGLVVIGWGEALNCGQAIFSNGTSLTNGYRQWSVNNFGLTYADAQQKNITNPVPWVADFTAPPNNNQLEDGTQSAVPRPFIAPCILNLYREVFQVQVVFLHTIGISTHCQSK